MSFRTAGWVLLVLGFAAWSSAEPVLREVKVRGIGLAGIDEPMIRSYISIRDGHELNRNEVASDVRALLESGKVADVKAEIERSGEGVVLTYVVRMKSRLVRPVKVVGAEEMS